MLHISKILLFIAAIPKNSGHVILKPSFYINSTKIWYKVNKYSAKSLNVFFCASMKGKYLHNPFFWEKLDNISYYIQY